MNNTTHAACALPNQPKGLSFAGSKQSYKPLRPETWHTLSVDQLQEAVRLAQSKGPGRHTAREIYGNVWASIPRPRRFGVLFKRAVDAGTVAGITRVGRRCSSQLYEVIGVVQ